MRESHVRVRETHDRDRDRIVDDARLIDLARGRAAEEGARRKRGRELAEQIGAVAIRGRRECEHERADRIERRKRL